MAKVNNRSFKVLGRHIFLIICSIIMFYPIFWWVGASLKKTEEMRLPTIFPETPMWSNYIDGWQMTKNYTFGDFFLNNIFITGMIVIGCVVTASLVAYAFGRLKFKFKGFFFSILILTLMLPPQVLQVPQYIMWNQFGFINSYVPIIAPHFFGGGSFFVFMLVQFVRGIPKELDEAAEIDGCSTYGIYFRIILPLIKPAMVTVGVFAFMWNWDNFFAHLLYITDQSKYTVSLGLRLFIDQFEIQWGQLLAMSLLSILPSALIFGMAQKHFVEGIATTGLKG